MCFFAGREEKDSPFSLQAVKGVDGGGKLGGLALKIWKLGVQQSVRLVDDTSEIDDK